MKLRILTKRTPRLFLLIALTIVLPIGIKLGLAAADIGYTVSGAVAFNGNAAPGVGVSLYTSDGSSSGSTHTDANGNYSVGSLLNGNHLANLTFSNYTQDSSTTGLPNYFNITSQYPYITVNGSDIQQNFSFNTNTLTVTVKDGNNQPESGLSVQVTAAGNSSVATSDGAETFNVSSGNEQSMGNTGSDGAVKLNVFPGSTYSVCVFTLSHGQYCAPANVTVNGDTTTEVDLPSFYTVSGVVTANSNAAPGVQVSLYTSDGSSSGSTHTDANGNYSVGNLQNGNHFANLVSSNTAQDSAAAGLPNYFNITSQNPFVIVNGSDITQNFSFNTNKLNVTVKDGNGNPAAGLSVQVTAVGSSNTVTTADGTQTFNAGTNVQTMGQTGNDGTVMLNVFPGITYSVCVFTLSHGQYCAPANVTVNGDTTTEVDLLSFSTVSGTVTANGSNPASGLELSLYTSDDSSSGSTHTDINGNYSIGSLLNGSYFANLVSSSPTQDSAGLPGSFKLTSQNPYILVNGNDVTQNFSFNTNTLTVTVKDGNGNTESGLPVQVTAVSSNNSITTADGSETFNVSGVDTQGETGTNGTVSLNVFPGITYSVCVFTLSHGQYCAPANVTVNANTSTTVYVANIPSSPTNLTAPSPTQNPVLSWDAVSGATSYNIYRNNTLIDHVDNPSTDPVTYTDYLATEGTNTYYVTAVNAAGESAHSNSVPVVVDRTAPVVTNLTWTANPLVQGQNTTISATATDSLSGVASVYYTQDGGAPQPMVYDSASNTWKATFGSSLAVNTYNIDVFATDQAGNTSTGLMDVLAVTATGYVSGHAWVIPSTSDTLPIALDTATHNPTQMVVGFSAKQGVTTSIDAHYIVKNNQDEFDFSSTSVDWVVIPDSTHASILVHGDLTTYVSGVKAVTQNVAMRLDVTLGANGAPDQVTVKLWNPGLNPSNTAPTYQASDSDILGKSQIIIQ